MMEEFEEGIWGDQAQDLWPYVQKQMQDAMALSVDQVLLWGGTPVGIIDNSHRYATQQKENEVNRSTVIKARLSELEAELIQVQIFEGANLDKDGTIVEFDRKYANRPTVYTYVAIRKGERWFTTGRFENAAMTDTEMIAKLLEAETVRAVVLKRKVKDVLK